jgi:predicted acyl esterase
VDAAKGTMSRDRLANSGETRFSAEADTPRDEARAVFVGSTFEQETEFTGPVMLKLWISSNSDDADLFAIVRKIGRDGRDVVFPGQSSPAIPAACGWLRASHSKLDPAKSTPSRLCLRKTPSCVRFWAAASGVR